MGRIRGGQPVTEGQKEMPAFPANARVKVPRTYVNGSSMG